MRKIYSAVAVFSILICVYFFFNLYNNSSLAIKSGREFYGENLTVKPTIEFVYKENLELKVNGQSITAQDVERQYEKIPEKAKENLTKDKVLETLVDQKLLLQEADKKGVAATDEEVEEYLEQIRTFSGLNESALEEQVSKWGYTLDEYRRSVKEMITVSSLLDKELDLRNISVSNSEVNSYMQKNKEEFRDIFSQGDTELESMLKSRVKQKLTLEKQQALVNNYMKSLRERARIERGGGV